MKGEEEDDEGGEGGLTFSLVLLLRCVIFFGCDLGTKRGEEISELKQ